MTTLRGGAEQLPAPRIHVDARAVAIALAAALAVALSRAGDRARDVEWRQPEPVRVAPTSGPTPGPPRPSATSRPA